MVHVTWKWSDGNIHQAKFTRQEMAKTIRGWRNNANITLTVNGVRSVTSKNHGIAAHVSWEPAQ